MGSYLNETEVGERYVSGPSAVFYRAGARHRNTTAAVGFEQIEIEFDPAWLGCRWLPRMPVALWIGGRVGSEARHLAHICQAETSDARLREAVREFLERAIRGPKPEPADWIAKLRQRLGEDTSLKISELAAGAHRHPSWVGSVYRQATGEGLQETAARLRVELATRLLRETGQELSCIALEAGFCDQSHMNRTFRRVLGRSPMAVRAERQHFRQAVR